MNLPITMHEPRFIVFGVKIDEEDPTDGFLVENHVDDFKEAVGRQVSMSVADYKARIWDNEKQGFVRQSVIDQAVEFLGR